MSSRYRFLLGIAAGLVAIRFIFLPWVEFQEARADSLKLTTDRLDRFDHIVQSRDEISSTYSRMTEQLQRALENYPTSPSGDQYRLMVQQELGFLAGECRVSISVFDVVLEDSRSGAGLEFVRVKLQVSGPMNGVARFQSEIESRSNVLIRNVKLDSVAAFPIASAGDALVQASLLTDHYFRLPKNSPIGSRK